MFLQNDIKALTDCEVMRKFYLKQSDRSGEKKYSVKIDSGRMNEGSEDLDYWAYRVQEREVFAHQGTVWVVFYFDRQLDYIGLCSLSHTSLPVMHLF